MKPKCLLIANGIEPQEVCGQFKIRVGSRSIPELHAWLDALAEHYEPTTLFGMVVWSNEDLNANTKADGEKRG